MKLSVVIVNYNVRNYLNLCLASIREATAGIQAEVWVYDNASTDGSKEHFTSPQFNNINYYYDSENIGFGKANNALFPKTSGEYVLILNPDTIVSREAIIGSIDFLDNHDQAAAVGVHMIDASGTYLKESKRGFPSPWVSFCKLSGLIKLFPSSNLFARYYLGHLDKETVQEVPILSGAYMMVRREKLFKAGLFDERYFMFGEDIDLSYSLLSDKSVNYYLPLRIVHFKGESTKQVSGAYRQAFFGAMSLFYDKYYPSSSKYLLSVLNGILKILSWTSLLKSKRKSNKNERHSQAHLTPWSIGDSSFSALIKRIETNGGGIHFLDL